MSEGQKGGRFDYVRYDEQSVALEQAIQTLPGSAERTLAERALEVTYMWVGKAIRDAQIKRGGDASHQPARGE